MHARVLFLGPVASPIRAYLEQERELVAHTEDRIRPQALETLRPDWIVSHGYRHILKPDVLSLAPSRFVNCHISYLPWNRGADPNFWSHYDDTPKGASIHLIDEGIDTGDLIAQVRMEFLPGDTLRTSYEHLQGALYALFVRTWAGFVAGEYLPTPQVGAGSFHRMADLKPLAHLLTNGWDTPLEHLSHAHAQRALDPLRLADARWL